MDIRLTPLPDTHQHFLDGAVDEAGMTSASGIALCLYGDPGRIAGIIDRSRTRPFSWRARQVICFELAEYSFEIIAALPLHRQGALISMGFAHILSSISSLSETCADWAHEDMTIGGALEPYRRHARHDDDFHATKGAARKLYAPGWIAKRARSYVEVLHLRDTARRMIQAGRNVPLNYDTGPVSDDINRQMTAFRAAWAQIPREDDYIGAPGWDAPTLAAYDRAGQPRPTKPRVRLVDKKARRIIKRATVMAAALLGASTVGAFARGEHVVLPGRAVDLQVRCVGPLAAQGHGRLAISVLDKAATPLADLCVYIKDTPALDQLTAFALHMEAGMEADVIRDANITRIWPAGVDHEAIRKPGKSHAAAWMPGGRMDEWARQRAARNAYYEATKDVWQREIRTIVLGRLAREMPHG